MASQFRHAVLPEATSEEEARQDFVLSLSQHCMNNVMPGISPLYEKRVLPEIKREKGREPETRHEIRKAMQRQPYYQMASSFQRTTQEMLWNSVDESVLRQLPHLIDKMKKVTGSKTKGSLTLDPGFEIPRYIKNNDHHVMPGGFSADLCENDITGGAMYDRGVFLFTDGMFGEKNDSVGKAGVRFIKTYYPDLKPNRILDVGCGVGMTTVPLKEEWPDAEVHGIDVGPAFLRYAHARAEEFGAEIHFHQMNGEGTGFEDNSFDLVICSTVFHETSVRAAQNLIKEAQRILRPGGVYVVGEQPPYEGKSAFEQFVGDWDTFNNNEPFWAKCHETDFVGICKDAGFAEAWSSLEDSVGSTNELEGKIDPGEIVGTDRGGGTFWFFTATK